MYALKYEIPDANTGISDETKPDLMTSDESNKDEANEDEADDDDVKSGVVKLDRKNKHAYELNETQKKEVSHNTNEIIGIDEIIMDEKMCEALKVIDAKLDYIETQIFNNSDKAQTRVSNAIISG